MRPSTGVGPRPPLSTTVFVSVCALAVALGQVGTADAQDPPYDRGISDACVEQALEADPFADVQPGQVHSGAIDCLWVYGVVQGRLADGENVYRPATEVNRQQMAAFIARTLEQVPQRFYTLPEADDGARFDDSDRISDVHVHDVNRLHDAGIVEGYGDGTYRPDEPVDRAQMASFIARSLEEVLPEELPRTEGVFDDLAGNTHQENIEKLAAVGIVQGSGGSYHPDAATTRAQMASFIARTMDHLVDADLLIAMQFAQGSATTYELTDVDWGQHDGRERVTFTLDNDVGTAGWRMRYVDVAIQDGSGHELDVEGDAIIEVVLTGTAPADVDTDLDASFGGVEVVEVVDGGGFEGRHQLFVGTTGLHALEASQLDEPRRVYVDVIPR